MEMRFWRFGCCETETRTTNASHSTAEKLRVRDALYGGRNKAMCVYRKAPGNEYIQYVYVVSLFPYICKYINFPIVHPVIHVGDACSDIEECLCMEGLIRYSIVPPDKLYNLVLPYRSNSKLMFCLCRTCVQIPIGNLRKPRMKIAPSRVPV